MRDAADRLRASSESRKERFVRVFLAYWKKHPDLRFGLAVNNLAWGQPILAEDIDILIAMLEHECQDPS